MAFDRIISRLVGRIADEVDTTPQPAVEAAVPFTQRLAKNLSRIADNLDSLGTEVAPNPGGPSNPVLSSIQIGERNFDIAGAGGAPLPNGTAGLDQLRWNTSANAWEASSGTTTSFGVLLPDDTDTKLLEALAHWHNNSGTSFWEPGFSIWSSAWGAGPSEASGGRSRINTVWLDGAANPYLWLLAPNHTDWIGYIPDGETDYTPNSTVRYTTRTNVRSNHEEIRHTQPAFDVIRNYLRIGGVSYDRSRLQIAGPRPDDEADRLSTSGSGVIWASMQIRYTAPPQTGTVISIIQQTQQGLRDALPPMLLSTRGFVLRNTANIILTFNEVLDVSTPPEKVAFDIQADQRPLFIRDAFFVSSAPTTLQIRARANTGPAVTGRERITVAYKPQITDGDLKDQAGNRVAGFSNVVIDFS